MHDKPRIVNYPWGGEVSYETRDLTPYEREKITKRKDALMKRLEVVKTEWELLSVVLCFFSDGWIPEVDERITRGAPLGRYSGMIMSDIEPKEGEIIGPIRDANTEIASTGKMLDQALQICRESGRRHGIEAFDELVAYIGLRLHIHKEALRIAEETVKELGKLKIIEAMVQTRYDHLGELFTRGELWNRGLGQNFTPHQIAEFMVQTTDIASLLPGQRILDPAMGTGRFLIVALRYAQPGVVLCGVDIDVRVYRAALVQMTMLTGYGASNPFFLLCEDSLRMKEFDVEKANKWNPVWGS